MHLPTTLMKRTNPFFVTTLSGTGDFFSSSPGRSELSSAGTLAPADCWDRSSRGREPGSPVTSLVTSLFVAGDDDDGAGCGRFAATCCCKQRRNKC